MGELAGRCCDLDWLLSLLFDLLVVVLGCLRETPCVFGFWFVNMQFIVLLRLECLFFDVDREVFVLMPELRCVLLKHSTKFYD